MDTATSTPAGPHFLKRTDSPIGRIELSSDGTAIIGLAIERDGALPYDTQPDHSCAVLEDAVTQLGEYFAGGRRQFALPLSVNGTEFQRAVWDQLAKLPFGEAASYADVGRATGRPTAGRAVGGAVGANPIPIIVPCHRVLASNQRITGYSGGNGIPTKVWLLDHEGITHR